MISNQRSGMLRRVGLYLFGFTFGIIAVNVIYKGKACQMPSTIKLNELIAQKRTYNPKTECLINCGSIDRAQIEKLLKQGNVNYDKSRVREKPYGFYIVESIGSDKKAIEFEIQDRDTISCITNITGLSIADSCECN